MKAGTTTLFRWLAEHPGCELPEVKEPHFFSLTEEFDKGRGHYLRNFAGIRNDVMTGEASASYADPRIARTVAQRMHALVPDVRLVYLVRSPEERLKSHYLHAWQRSRERRPLHQAIKEPDNRYVALSLYADALRPFVDMYGSDRVLLLHLSDLDGPTASGWHAVTSFLDLDPRSGAGERANRTVSKVGFSPALLRLWRSGWLDRAAVLPGPVRQAGRRLLNRQTVALQKAAQEVHELELPTEVRERLHEQWEEVHALLGVPAPSLGGASHY